MKVRLTDYCEDWVRMFQTEAAFLKTIFGDEIIKCEHFGSTSVKGMKAKPVIDMMCIVKNIEKIDLFNNQMDALGYDVAGEWGIVGRRLFRKGGDNRTHHIHFYQFDHPGIERHLIFRDYLKAHPKEVAKYSQFKEELAQRYETTGKYNPAKKKFVSEMEQKHSVGIQKARGGVNMYKHVIWDFDGTLFDTYPVMAKVFKELLLEQGIDEPLEDILSQLKISAATALKYYEKKYQIDEEFIAKYKEQKMEAEMELSKPFDGVEEICKYIYTTNRKNYILTHRGESSIELLKNYGLYDYFSEFITSKQGFERKPSPTAINYLINKYNIVHTEAIMIGDRDLDLLSGKNAGISACYFTEINETNDISDYVITDLQQLRSIL